MGLDLWFRADVARILQATNEAMCSTAAVMGAGLSDDVEGRERAAGYRQGFGAALRAVAAGFGLTESAPGGLPDWWRPAGARELMPLGAEIDGEWARGDF
jgi:hypothetical protein